MTSRRPGAPRSRRPVAASPAGRKTSSTRGAAAAGTARSAARSTRPAPAARPQRTPRGRDEREGPAVVLTRRSLFLITIIVIALAVVVPTLNTYIAQKQELSALQQEVAQQEADVEDLQAQVDRWEDPTFVAAQARERLLFAMPGETQYRLTDTSGEDVPLTEQEQTAREAAQRDWFTTLWKSVEGASRLDPEDVPTAPEEDTSSENPDDGDTE